MVNSLSFKCLAIYLFLLGIRCFPVINNLEKWKETLKNKNCLLPAGLILSPSDLIKPANSNEFGESKFWELCKGSVPVSDMCDDLLYTYKEISTCGNLVNKTEKTLDVDKINKNLSSPVNNICSEFKAEQPAVDIVFHKNQDRHIVTDLIKNPNLCGVICKDSQQICRLLLSTVLTKYFMIDHLQKQGIQPNLSLLSDTTDKGDTKHEFPGSPDSNEAKELQAANEIDDKSKIKQDGPNIDKLSKEKVVKEMGQPGETLSSNDDERELKATLLIDSSKIPAEFSSNGVQQMKGSEGNQIPDIGPKDNGINSPNVPQHTVYPENEQKSTDVSSVSSDKKESELMKSSTAKSVISSTISNTTNRLSAPKSLSTTEIIRKIVTDAVSSTTIENSDSTIQIDPSTEDRKLNMEKQADSSLQQTAEGVKDKTTDDHSDIYLSQQNSNKSPKSTFSDMRTQANTDVLKLTGENSPKNSEELPTEADQNRMEKSETPNSDDELMNVGNPDNDVDVDYSRPELVEETAVQTDIQSDQTVNKEDSIPVHETIKTTIVKGDEKNSDSSAVIDHSSSQVSSGMLPEQEDGHFFFYLLSAIVICAVGYLVFHNKQKIMALIIEGRHERRRRPHTGTYKRLDNKEGSKVGSHAIF